jgi:membrane associated rhomboid family serine protease
MFGLEPDVLCGPCADGVRTRYNRALARRDRTRQPVVTALVIAVAAALFVVEHLVRPQPGWVHDLQAGWLIWSGHVWLLVTTAFLHGGWIHALFNLYCMWILGGGIELEWGPLAWAGLVLGGAAVASAAEWAINGPGVGLSGVVYAAAGFLFAQTRHNPVAAALMGPRNTMTLIVWFFVCIILTNQAGWRVGNWAHGAGAVWGLAAGYATASPRRKILVPAVALLTIAIVAAAPFVAFGEQAERRAAWIEFTRR